MDDICEFFSEILHCPSNQCDGQQSINKKIWGNFAFWPIRKNFASLKILHNTDSTKNLEHDLRPSDQLNKGQWDLNVFDHLDLGSNLNCDSQEPTKHSTQTELQHLCQSTFHCLTNSYAKQATQYLPLILLINCGLSLDHPRKKYPGRPSKMTTKETNELTRSSGTSTTGRRTRTTEMNNITIGMNSHTCDWEQNTTLHAVLLTENLSNRTHVCGQQEKTEHGHMREQQ